MTNPNIVSSPNVATPRWAVLAMSGLAVLTACTPSETSQPPDTTLPPVTAAPHIYGQQEQAALDLLNDTQMGPGSEQLFVWDGAMTLLPGARYYEAPVVDPVESQTVPPDQVLWTERPRTLLTNKLGELWFGFSLKQDQQRTDPSSSNDPANTWWVYADLPSDDAGGFPGDSPQRLYGFPSPDQAAPCVQTLSVDIDEHNNLVPASDQPDALVATGSLVPTAVAKDRLKANRLSPLTWVQAGAHFMSAYCPKRPK
jgi:hypothetical protein